ncbi:MAG: phytanoyl-CoA dioxygenase family protein [Pseudomonadota bacterium]
MAAVAPLTSLHHSDDDLLHPDRRRLSAVEIEQFARDGYVKNLPVFSAAGVAGLQRGFESLASRLPADIDISRVNMWHKCSRWFYDLCRTPAILDYVEDLLGPNFYQWGGQFFVKYPGDGTVVPWHQDAQYWPLAPRRTVTVWLALFDTDTDNAAMQVVRGSHREGEFEHTTNDAPHLTLDQEVAQSAVDPERVVTLSLRAGEISLHDDGLLHGSGPNDSNRVRAGITMRYCPTHVRCDRRVWPTFECYMARGSDAFRLNPHGVAPDAEGFPVRRFQHSSEFTGQAM